MKPLNYLNRNAIAFYDEIIQNKDMAARQPLQALRRKIKRQYRHYRKNLRKLERLTCSAIQVKEHHPFLVGCYTSKTNGLTALKLALQTDVGVKKCPFCGLNKANTLDHYLPKGIFPEFAVLYWNLIPCCFDCNNMKDEDFLQDGVRMFAHAGADPLPKMPLFEVRLLLGTQLNYDLVPNPMLPIVWHNHIVNLDLCSRYKDQYDSTFENTVECAREAHYQDGLTLNQIEHNLRRDCQAIFRLQGRNDMEGLIKQAIAAQLAAVI